MLKGKNAIITGARRGIGHATVEVFAENGANIWACARTPDAEFETALAALSEKHGVWIKPVYFDLADEAALKVAVKGILSEKRPVDILVNNAGVIAESTSFAMTSITKVREIFETNFFAQIALTQYVSRLMTRAGKGSIVNLASVAALDGEPGQLEYIGSKGAIIGATKKLARELGAYGIRVNAVAPGIIDTDMGNEAEEGLMHRVLDGSVLKRKGTPREIANVIAFLSSDLSSYMTGQTVRVDGGL